MSKSGIDRRSFVKQAVAAGLATSTAAICASTEPEHKLRAADVKKFPPPPELATLNSREYGKKRIQKFQQGVRDAGLDVLLISNRSLDYTGYVSNYHPSSMQPGVAFIPAEGEPRLFVQMYSSAHARMAKRIMWIDDLVDVPKDPVSETDSRSFYTAVTSTLKDRGLTKGKIGLAGGEIDWLLPAYFREQLPEMHTEDANPLLWSLIMKKDDVELALMRYTAKISDEVAFPLIKQMLVPGTLDRDIFTEVIYAMMRAGSDNPRLILGAAPYSAGIWATPAQDRKIQEGDIVLCEPIVTFHNYQTERMYTFAVGKNIPESEKRGAQVIYDSFQIALQEMKPGKEFREVYEKCNNYIKSQGYSEGSTVLIGHFIGINNHEGGRITSEGTKGLVLEPGMVISWHPNVVVLGDKGVRTISSSSLLITDKGVEMLSKQPMQPIVYV